MYAPMLWFYSLTGAAGGIAPWLKQAKVKKILGTAIGLVMRAIAWSLFKDLGF